MPAIVLLFLLVNVFCNAAESDIFFSDKAPTCTTDVPIVCWAETRETPRPIKIRFIRFDLENNDYELITMVSDDPDGKGPADAVLEEPDKLARRHNAIVAVNANGFMGFSGRKGEADSNWFINKPVKIAGLSITNGTLRSRQTGHHFSFWIGRNKKPNMGTPDTLDTIKEAVTEWSGYLVHRGKIITYNTEKLHPRTLLGIDKSSRWLFLVVVDGRQIEISEGINLLEAAELMKSIGCQEAMAMDGGGSSIMLVTDSSPDNIRIINNPSSVPPRPIPVMLGIRKCTTHQTAR
ncbi:MAG: hypothetical protein A2283_02525 [Lentisphaerae bacterium RIFOXYA12_FULL_48_11]|nr:MAG: hypothetical protein A2283_02525 [Lentisphaerae bacterium RIFOXYA12_FULL_48_11]